MTLKTLLKTEMLINNKVEKLIALCTGGHLQGFLYRGDECLKSVFSNATEELGSKTALVSVDKDLTLKITDISETEKEALTSKIDGIDLDLKTIFLLAENNDNFIKDITTAYLADMCPFIDEKEDVAVLEILNFEYGKKMQNCKYTLKDSPEIFNTELQISDNLLNKTTITTRGIKIDMCNYCYQVY